MSTGSHVSLQTGTTIIRINILTKIYGDIAKNVTSREFTRKTAQPCYIRSFMKGAPGLVMGPCIVDRIVIREVQFQLEVNRCRNEEIIVKGNFGWAWPMWQGHPRIDRIAIRETDRHRAQTCHDDPDNKMWPLEKNAEPLAAMFSTNQHHVELVQDIIGMNLLTIFHDIAK
ncbi:hypothetical protein DPMN_169812 [Dreissena polymorpha]|uniref:Uncharacterized protein n=1 Tax=Dreissena polymorpha TaxID=45954 RepID=A0A9D4DXF6_DREPO|nr:hypothetical protein DPMN_169812 [Dreissena polymorpha]